MKTESLIVRFHFGLFYQLGKLFEKAGSFNAVIKSITDQIKKARVFVVPIALKLTLHDITSRLVLSVSVSLPSSYATPK